jgi:Pyruvate/2-oxoacid:ferredoxin oxidoreductase delta subunit
MPVPFPATESGVEIRILKRLFSEEDAELTLCLSAIPETLPAIHRRMQGRMSAESLRSKLDEMAARGLIERHEQSSETKYGKSLFVIGIYERQVDRLTEELERDVRQYQKEAFGQALHSQSLPQFRIVPVNQSLTPERQVALYDDIRAFTCRTDGPFAVMNCICRQGKDLLKEPCHQTSLRKNCLMFGDAARAMVRQGAAEFVTREEMLEHLSMADREGLVLEAHNVKNPYFVCCCCGCCCGVLTAAKRLPRPADYFRTNYYAGVDAAICENCGACVPRCQMDAVTAGDGGAYVEKTRCIGCGLCVSTCPSGAMRLVPKEKESVPPKDVVALYLQMYRHRFGTVGLASALGRSVAGQKV